MVDIPLDVAGLCPIFTGRFSRLQLVQGQIGGDAGDEEVALSI